MYDPIFVPLDGSPLAEGVLPYALGLARATGAKLLLLTVVEDEDERAADDEYIRGLAGRLEAQGTLLQLHRDVASTIVEEVAQYPNGLLAMTTHGRTGVLEAILGSVALRVVQRAGRPVLVWRPHEARKAGEAGSPAGASAVVLPLDGSDFAERMVPHAVEMASSLGARLEFVQVLPAEPPRPPMAPPGDVLESSYVRSMAESAGRAHGLETNWEVLHGDAADSICDYVSGRGDLILAMSSHGRSGLGLTILGSVTSECVRRSGVPVLVYRPSQ